MRRLTMTALLAGLVLSTHPAAAQDLHTLDVSMGAMNVNGTMFGTSLQVFKPVTKHWSLGGEIDWSRGQDPGDDTYTYTDTAALGGVRYNWQPTPRFAPFWQVMTGVLSSKGEGSWCSITGRCFDESFHYNYFALQPGGGMTFMLTPRFGVRAQGDLQLAMYTDDNYVTVFPRMVVGGVFALGAR